ncbi:J domain-containing protein [Pseudomonas sp. R5(2019)]|uniref:J domain-containing protein n=1 Tax=Pseudomonas sp. R5(2019) TaxID=2697566 RepID=UPI0014129104|nr:J domain-containing protein [Pseudomonas sp. R5(2019)]NBA98554.1 J domain-containing protein [Pseudomonas sp. R5(2019)]
MSQNILKFVEILAAAGGGIVLIAIAFNFLAWLVEAIYRQACAFIEYAAGLLIKSTRLTGCFLSAVVIELMLLVLNAMRAGWMWLYQPCFLAARKVTGTVRQYVKLRQLFWKYGRQEFATFGQFKRHMLGEEEPPPKAKPEKPAPEKSGYAQALEVLGFSEDTPLDKAMLKARHRELATILHPHKAFPNQVFMQQVNDAVDYIKRAQKWK